MHAPFPPTDVFVPTATRIKLLPNLSRLSTMLLSAAMARERVTSLRLYNSSSAMPTPRWDEKRGRRFFMSVKDCDPFVSVAETS
jgi:hypothetical protein